MVDLPVVGLLVVDLPVVGWLEAAGEEVAMAVMPLCCRNSLSWKEWIRHKQWKASHLRR